MINFDEASKELKEVAKFLNLPADLYIKFGKTPNGKFPWLAVYCPEDPDPLAMIIADDESITVINNHMEPNESITAAARRVQDWLNGAWAMN